MRIVLLGPPGAGKGTLANLIKEKFNILHISTGDIFREEMKSQSKLGGEIKRYVESGKLVPDKIVTQIVKNKLLNDKVTQKGYMLDGFPRTRTQAIELDRILARIRQPIDYALYMEASLPVIIERLTGRRVCRDCGALYHIVNKPPKGDYRCDDCHGEIYQRADDNEETIKTRMDVYLKKTTPIIQYYEGQNKLRTVDADHGSDHVLNYLVKLLNEDSKANNNKVSRRA